MNTYEMETARRIGAYTALGGAVCAVTRAALWAKTGADIDMQSKSTSINSPSTMGDAAVEGLLHGLAAGVIMAGYLAVAGLVTRSAATTWLNMLTSALGVELAMIVFGHFAMAAFYGVIWGVLARYLLGRLSLPAWAWGLVYGGALWAASTVLLPAGVALPCLVSGGAHLVFGASLGLLSGRTHAPV